MGAELGATCSVFPFDEHMSAYLAATGRGALAELAAQNRDLCTADAETAEQPAGHYDEVVEIDLSTLEPHIVGPHTPDLARPISTMAEAVKAEGYQDRISTALVGSCTNSSYEDISRAADVAAQAAEHGVKTKSRFMVTPGSEMIHSTIERDGQLQTLESIGASVMANACGPCIGQWKRDDIQKGQTDTIVTSFNRNFPGRNDANPETLAFIASPEIVVALGLAGRLSFNPLSDSIAGDGGDFRLRAPAPAPEIPERGFERDGSGYVAPSDDPDSIRIVVDPNSERLALLEPFAPPTAEEFSRMPLLLKTKGKTTTDHISPAGPWLRYRGHLDAISNNMFTGAIRAWTGDRGQTRNPLTGAFPEPVPQVARALKAAGKKWVVVGDENYGEGSSREHAAMSPRLLGCGAVIVRSFARIHESNLKKQGILPLRFVDPSDYDLVREDDEISILDPFAIQPGRRVRAVLHHADGSRDEIELSHTLNADQMGWFKACSALNTLG